MDIQLVCPRCGSTNVSVNVVQENAGSVTKQHTKTKYKEQKHGILWWCFVGWWWWIIDAFIWIFAFFPRALLHIGRRKKYKGDSISTAKTKNIVRYKTICICQNCAHSWEK